MQRVRAVLRRVTPWWWCFAALFAVGSAWSLTTPPFAVTDEASQVVRAIAAGHGDFVGAYTAEVQGGGGAGTVQRLSAFHQPVGFVYDWQCFIGQPTKTARCAGVLDGIETEQDIPSYHGAYPPLYYTLVGWPASILPPPQSYYVMRLVSVALSAALIASALRSALERRSRLTALGVLVAATPAVLFLSGGIHSSGFEIAAAIGLWSGLLALVAPRPEEQGSEEQGSEEQTPGEVGAPSAEAPSGSTAVLTAPDVAATPQHVGAPSSRLIVRTAIAGGALMLARPLSPVWVVLILAFALLLTDRARLHVLLRNRAVLVAAGAVAITGVLALVWYVTQEPGLDLIRYAEGVEPAGRLADLRSHGARIDDRLHDMLGLYGWPFDVLAPVSTVVTWATATILLLAGAFAVAARRGRVVLAGLLLTIIVLPMLMVAAQANTYVDGWVGRYDLPLAVGAVIVAADLLARRAGALGRFAVPLTRWVLALVAVGSVGAYLTMAHRYVAGAGGPILYVFNVKWAPKLPAWLLLLVMVAATVALAWGTGRAVVGRSSPFVRQAES